MAKKHLYFFPGLGASPKIFEYISLPEDRFEKYIQRFFKLTKKQSKIKTMGLNKEKLEALYQESEDTLI